MNNISISAFIVTFNRIELLKKVISAIEQQTVKVSNIIIINNGSTDGTTDWLARQSHLHVVNQENLGGAFGFHTGVKESYKFGNDYIWMMDDDAFPAPDYLERLLEFKDQFKVMGGVVVENDKIDYNHQGIFYPKHKMKDIFFPRYGLDYTTLSKNKESQVVNVDFLSFIGLLVHKSVIDQVGFPVDNYFIFNDDVEFSMRISQKRIKKALIVSTCMYHKIYNDKPFLLDRYSKNTGPSLSLIKQRASKKQELVSLYDLLGVRNALNNYKYFYGMDFWSIYKVGRAFIISILISPLYYKQFIKSNILLGQAYLQGLNGRFDTEKLRKAYLKNKS